MHPGRTPHGVRELKRNALVNGSYLRGRTPHGVRELKRGRGRGGRASGGSHPSRGA